MNAIPIAVDFFLSVAWLAGYTALFMAISSRAYRREQSLKFT